jgi:hypothetical protein
LRLNPRPGDPTHLQLIITPKKPSPQTPGSPPKTPLANPWTTAHFEAALNKLFEAAAGESFVDVSSRQLYMAVAGTAPGSQSLNVCQKLMVRAMIPGDCDLTGAFQTKHALLIRYVLPRPAQRADSPRSGKASK